MEDALAKFCAKVSVEGFRSNVLNAFVYDGASLTSWAQTRVAKLTDEQVQEMGMPCRDALIDFLVSGTEAFLFDMREEMEDGIFYEEGEAIPLWTGANLSGASSYFDGGYDDY